MASSCWRRQAKGRVAPLSKVARSRATSRSGSRGLETAAAGRSVRVMPPVCRVWLLPAQSTTCVAGTVPIRPFWKSSKAWASSARVFMTKGP